MRLLTDRCSPRNEMYCPEGLGLRRDYDLARRRFDAQLWLENLPGNGGSIDEKRHALLAALNKWADHLEDCEEQP